MVLALSWISFFPFKAGQSGVLSHVIYILSHVARVLSPMGQLQFVPERGGFTGVPLIDDDDGCA